MAPLCQVRDHARMAGEQWQRVRGRNCAVLRPHGSPKLTALVTVVTIALSVSACNGDDEPDPTTVPTVATSIAPSTTATSPTSSTTAAPSTTQPPSTTAPSSTAPTPSAPTTPPTAPTDTQPRTTLETTDPDTLAVVGALYSYLDAFATARTDPNNAALEAAAAATTTGEMTTVVADTLAQLRERGQASRINATVLDRHEIIEFSIGVDGDLAALDACWINTNTLVQVGAEADGSDKIVSEGVTSYTASYSFMRVGERWLVSGRDLFDEFPDQEGCS